MVEVIHRKHTSSGLEYVSWRAGSWQRAEVGRGRGSGSKEHSYMKFLGGVKKKKKGKNSAKLAKLFLWNSSTVFKAYEF